MSTAAPPGDAEEFRGWAIAAPDAHEHLDAALGEACRVCVDRPDGCHLVVEVRLSPDGQGSSNVLSPADDDVPQCVRSKLSAVVKERIRGEAVTGHVEYTSAPDPACVADRDKPCEVTDLMCQAWKAKGGPWPHGWNVTVAPSCRYTFAVIAP